MPPLCRAAAVMPLYACHVLRTMPYARFHVYMLLHAIDDTPLCHATLLLLERYALMPC